MPVYTYTVNHDVYFRTRRRQHAHKPTHTRTQCLGSRMLTDSSTLTIRKLREAGSQFAAMQTHTQTHEGRHQSTKFNACRSRGVM